MKRILEEILNDIDKEVKCQKKICGGLENTSGWRIYESAAEVFKNIVRLRVEGTPEIPEFVTETNVGSKWIPCSKRLPEETGYYLVQLTKKMASEDYADRTVALYSEEDKCFMSYGKLIIAWQPLPEPYKEESNEK